jgi:hypothetical protein
VKCYTCGCAYQEHEGTLDLHNDIIGNYDVYAARYYKCDGCGVLLFPKDTVKKIELAEADKQNRLIRQLPVNDFIIATEASELLGISKQAFHKHRRIKKGFIYSVILGGKRLYNRKSVLLFKDNGDGRFKLSEQSSKEDVKYIIVNKSITPDHSIYKGSSPEEYKNLYSGSIKEVKTENQHKVYH